MNFSTMPSASRMQEAKPTNPTSELPPAVTPVRPANLSAEEYDVLFGGRPQISGGTKFAIGGIVVVTLALLAVGGFFLIRFFVQQPASPINSVQQTPQRQEPPPPSATNDTGDIDNDGLTNAEEQKWGTDPANADTDGDGYRDGEEVDNGYSPLQKART